ncbi:hypothetical protein Osc1_09440 [Hominimerdicola sp. 21CYCFAH17_S]
MNNTTTLIIEDLSHLKGKSADHVTRFLKRCGGGNESTMVDGLIKIVRMLDEDKVHCVKNARVGGITIGVICTAIIGGSAYLIHKHREKCQSRKKMQEVAEILKQEVALADEEKLPVDEKNNVTED